MDTVHIQTALGPYRGVSSNYGEPSLPLSDHLPMTVIALEGLGAKPARIESWARAYHSKHALRLADDGEQERRRTWLALISKHGRVELLQRRLEHLAGGMGAAAFHSAIRASYALIIEDDEELAAALESWEREYLGLPVCSPDASAEAQTSLATLARSTIAVHSPGLISSAMQLVGKEPAFIALAQCSLDARELNNLAIAAAATFARTGNFTALHVMTGTYAMLTFRARLGDVSAAMGGFWSAYAAAALAARKIPTLDPTELETLRAEPCPSWDVLCAQAVAQDDEHVIKAIYAAYHLELLVGDPIFRVAAARYARR
jgi:hypothetical protein